MTGSFLDTNILVYAISADPAKADIADALITKGGTISVQVLNEFANVSLGKLGRSHAETRGYLTAVRHVLNVTALTFQAHELGLALAERYGLHIYDAMIASCALLANCDTLYSEDMHDGLEIDGRLKVVNPFRLAS